MRALFALFERSLREDIRARLPTILRATLVIVILLIIWANERDFARRAAPGREFLAMSLFANLGLIVIATLGIFSSAITEEKEDQTLTLLRMTKLSPLAILFGKSTTRLIGALLLLAVQIPFTLLAVTLGGVSMQQVLGSYAVLGATTFFLCNLALLCSVTCRSSIRAGIWTGVIGGIVFALLPIIGIATSLRRMRPGALSPQTVWEHIATWAVEANPLYSLVMLIEGRGAAPIAMHVSTNLGAGVLCFLLAWLLFDRFCATDGEIVVGRRWKGLGILGKRGSRSRPSVAHPLAWKDFHFLIGGRRMLSLRFALCGLIFLGVYGFQWFVVDEFRAAPDFWHRVGELCIVFATGLFALEVGLLASRIFGDERRSLTLGSLISLPRSTGWLIRQKLRGCVAVVLPSVVLFAVGVWLEESWRSWNGIRSIHMSDEDWMAVLYITSQALLLPVLIANLSLRLRRGALPAGIAIVTSMNVLTVVLCELASLRGRESDIVGAMGLVGCVLVIVLGVLTYRSIPQAGAAE